MHSTLHAYVICLYIHVHARARTLMYVCIHVRSRSKPLWAARRLRQTRCWQKCFGSSPALTRPCSKSTTRRDGPRVDSAQGVTGSGLAWQRSSWWQCHDGGFVSRREAVRTQFNTQEREREREESESESELFIEEANRAPEEAVLNRFSVAAADCWQSACARG